ncbi:MAG: hypothetical protein IPL26_18650 [Leptospiraceae bacterium]|nr:hypothetical protein [Leptospiraceae bacterium]
MKTADYFTITFKKPEITESITQIIERKNKLKEKLDSCYSRLESVSLCNENSNPDDALLLSEFLIQDICNLALSFSGLSQVTTTDHWREKIKSIPHSEIISAFTKHISIIDKQYKSKEEKSEEIENSLAVLLFTIEKYIFKTNKFLFENPVDFHNSKIKFQISIGIILIGLISYFGFNQYNKLKPIKNDVVKIYYLNQQIFNFNTSNEISVNVNPSEEWKEINFILPAASDVNEIKIEPVHQIHARFQIKEIKFLDESKKIISERNFKLNNLGMLEPSTMKEICCMEGIKSGKLIPEKYLEMESINSSPSFSIKLENISGVKEISLTFRYIKNKTKFLN